MIFSDYRTSLTVKSFIFKPVDNDYNRSQNTGHPRSGQIPGDEVEGAEEEPLQRENGFHVEQDRGEVEVEDSVDGGKKQFLHILKLKHFNIVNQQNAITILSLNSNL